MIVTLLRKPLIGGGGILNALPCACLNIDASRVGTSKSIPAGLSKDKVKLIYGGYGLDSRDNSGWNPNIGRFPANVIVRVAVQSAFPEVVGATSRSGNLYAAGQSLGLGLHSSGAGTVYQDSTLSASRFFKNLVK